MLYLYGQVVGTTLADINAKAEAAATAFFGPTTFTLVPINQVQAHSYDANGNVTDFVAGFVATSGA